MLTSRGAEWLAAEVLEYLKEASSIDSTEATRTQQPCTDPAGEPASVSEEGWYAVHERVREPWASLSEIDVAALGGHSLVISFRWKNSERVNSKIYTLPVDISGFTDAGSIEVDNVIEHLDILLSTDWEEASVFPLGKSVSLIYAPFPIRL